MATLTETPAETSTENLEALKKITRISVPHPNDIKRVGEGTFIVQCHVPAGAVSSKILHPNRAASKDELIVSRKLSSEACGALQSELQSKLNIGSIVVSYDPRVSGASLFLFKSDPETMETAKSYFQEVLHNNNVPATISTEEPQFSPLKQVRATLQ